MRSGGSSGGVSGVGGPLQESGLVELTRRTRGRSVHAAGVRDSLMESGLAELTGRCGLSGDFSRVGDLLVESALVELTRRTRKKSTRDSHRLMYPMPKNIQAIVSVQKTDKIPIVTCS